MDNNDNTQSSLIFGFLVAFLAIFALGVTGGVAWPRIRLRLAMRYPIFQVDEDPPSIAISQKAIPELWNVRVQEVVKSASASECAWEHLRAVAPE